MMIRKFVTIVGTLGIIAAGFGLITVMNMLKPKPEKVEEVFVAPSVLFVTAQTTPTTLDVVVQGEVRPRTDINLTAQVGGRITYLSSSFVAGGAFEKGDELIRIEDADYQLAVTRANARVAQAQQSLRQEQAEADLARRDWEELGDGSQPSDLTLRLPQLAQAKANYDAAQADYDEARLNLSRTKVRAPFKGRVRRRIAGEGQFVGPGAQLGDIFSTDVAEIRLPLTDRNLATLGLPFGFSETKENLGPQVTLRATIGASENEWRGRIARTEGSIDPTTRQIGAIAVVDDPYGKGAANGIPLAMGLFVEATITGNVFEEAIILPLTALYGRDSVYTIDDENKLLKKLVRIVNSTATTMVIAGGVDVGDRVVVSPLRGSDDGDEVTPVAEKGTRSQPRSSDTNISAETNDISSQSDNKG